MRGYHVYQEMWVAAVGKELSSVRETENHRDPFSVVVVRSGVTVGHDVDDEDQEDTTSLGWPPSRNSLEQ